MFYFCYSSAIILRKILFKFGALEILSNLLDDPIYKKRALLAFINYAKILKRKSESKVYFKNIPSKDLSIPADSKDKITFILNGGIEVYVDRKILIDKSEVFEVMLNSDFLENRGIIHLDNVEEDSMKYFFKLLYLDLESDDINPPLPATMKSAAEALMLTDKYLLEDLNSFVCKVIVQFLLKSNSVHELYEQSILLKTENLKHECIAYILNNSEANRQICDLVNSDKDDQLVNILVSDIEELFRQELHSYENVI